MARYAVMSNGIVANIIWAEEADEAALPLILSDAEEIIKESDSTGPAYFGGDLFDGKFRMPKPFQSWVWVDGSWEAPIPYPQDDNSYYWDESLGEWIMLEPIVPSDEDQIVD